MTKLTPGDHTINFRNARQADAGAVAALHADSWRHHYRGAYTDEFLDADVYADRYAAWADRLTHQSSGSITILAEEHDSLVGFAHTIFDDDPRWGALLDNLHVVYARKRAGIGTLLLAETARAVIEQRPGSGLYLWVLEQNEAAQAFYHARGGRIEGRKAVQPPSGVPGRLKGSPIALRIVWPDPSALL